MPDDVTLSAAQRVALAGMAVPVLLCRVFTLDAFSKEPSLCWTIYVPQEYARPDFWALTDEEGEALVAAGLVEPFENVYPGRTQKITLCRITDAGRALVKTKRLRKKCTREDPPCAEQDDCHGKYLGSVSRRPERRAAPARAGEGTLPFADPV